MNEKADQTGLTQEQVAEALVGFVNDWPLYSPRRLLFADTRSFLPELPARLLRWCETCEAEPTWARSSPAPNSFPDSTVSLQPGEVARYTCSHCESEHVTIWYTRTGLPALEPGSGTYEYRWATFTKLGQTPAPETRPDPAVAKALGAAEVELYKKGLRSLAFGFGLAALAYYRRVVEGSAGKILSMVSEAAAEEGDEETVQRVEEAARGRNTEDKLRLAAEALPASLRPGGSNPLSVLFKRYSRGIHQLSDEECIVVAQQLQFALEYMFRNWQQQLDAARRFGAEIRKWSDPSTTPEQ